jgi:hypothetical protein
MILAALAASLVLPAVAYAAATDPKERLTAADQAKAKSLLLIRSDLPVGWTRVPTSAEEDVKCAGFDPNLSDLTLTGDQESGFRNQQSGANVYSYASLFKTPEEAGAAWNRVMKPALVKCLVQVLEDAVGDRASITFTKQARVSFPIVSQRVFAMEVNCTIKATGAGAGVGAPVSLDVVTLGRGRAEVTLMAMGTGKGIASADLRAFARLLAARMKQAGV